jgi:ribonuclease-3
VAFVRRLFAPLLQELPQGQLLHLEPKSALQELAQRRGWALPVYREIEVRGPEHQRLYIYEVEVGGQVRGRGEGSSKKLAQKEAARSALQSLEDEA